MLETIQWLCYAIFLLSSSRSSRSGPPRDQQAGVLERTTMTNPEKYLITKRLSSVLPLLEPRNSNEYFQLEESLGLERNLDP